MRFTSMAAMAALGAVLISPMPGQADDDRCRGPIDAAQAVAIARGVGLVRVEEVECNDDRWEVEGRDAFGREIEVEISARTGRIIEVDRDD